MKKLLAGAVVLALALSVRADDVGTRFAYKDWELVCDNTLTCRAVGYHAADGVPVSVLLTRPAGPAQPVRALVRLGESNDGLPGVAPEMAIDNRSLGNVHVDSTASTAALSHDQTDSLLGALTKTGTVRWSSGAAIWTLSSAGATAVLLKMDEVQGRVGTPGAIVRKGGRPELDVPAAPAAPLTIAAILPVPLRLPAARAKAIEAALLDHPSGVQCESLGANDAQAGTPLSVRATVGGKYLVSAMCHSGSATTLWSFWSTNTAPPFDPVLLLDDVTEIGPDGVRSARAMHDCSSSEERTWDGQRFVLTRALTAGMCAQRGFTFGAWQLPTFVGAVRHADGRTTK